MRCSVFRSSLMIILFLCTTIPALAMLPENDGWPVEADNGTGRCSPVADMTGDGFLEVVSCVNEWRGYMLRHDGRVLPGWPHTFEDPVHGPIAIADIDGDGWLEAFFDVGETWTPHHRLVPLHHDRSGLPGWPYQSRRCLMSSAAISDLNADGLLEVVLTQGIDGGNCEGEPIELVVLGADGFPIDGWPISFDANHLYAPAIADLDLDGDLEIVVTGDREVGFSDDDALIWAFHHDGSPYGSGEGLVYVEDDWVAASVTVADLGGDPRPELLWSLDQRGAQVFRQDGSYFQGWEDRHNRSTYDPIVALFGRDQPNRLIATAESEPWFPTYAGLYDPRGNALPGWPVQFGGNEGAICQVTVADLDGDRALEAVISGGDHYLYAHEFDGSMVEGWPINTGDYNRATSTFADLDQDGDTDLIHHGYEGRVHVYDTNGRYELSRIEVDHWMYDQWHTGAYHKDLYREAESLAPTPGWIETTRPRAWGGVSLQPASSDPAPLSFTFEVPVWKIYCLWARVRAGTSHGVKRTTVRIDGESIAGGGKTNVSPGDWQWIKLGSRDIQSGLHEIEFEWQGSRPEIDRFLLTTRGYFPLQDETPHAW